MAINLPLKKKASDVERMQHRQRMIDAAAPAGRDGEIKGFRSDFIARNLVASKQADPSILLAPPSERMKAKRKAKVRHLAELREDPRHAPATAAGNAFRAREARRRAMRGL